MVETVPSQQKGTGMNLHHIDRAIRSGCRVHAFRSGGGLRVVRVEDPENNLKGYGEHPHIEDALAHANLDCKAGGRPYEEVYGKIYPHYLTGSSTPTSFLDDWLLRGRTFDAWQDGADIVLQLVGIAHVEIPEEIASAVRKTGVPTTWEHRGYTYEISRTILFGEKRCVSTRVIKSPPEERQGADSALYRVTKTGTGKTFEDALQSALRAPEVENMQDGAAA